MKKYRTFSVEFKKTLIAEIETGAVSKAEASRTHNIAPSLLDKWQQKFRDGTLSAKPSDKERRLEKELEQCKMKIADLVLEVDTLKKLQEFAQRRRSLGYVVTSKDSTRSNGGVE